MNEYLERLAVKKPVKPFSQVTVEEFEDFHPNKKRFNPSILKRLDKLVVDPDNEDAELSFEVVKPKTLQKVVLSAEEDEFLDEEDEQKELENNQHVQQLLHNIASRLPTKLPSKPMHIKVERYIMNNREKFVGFIQSLFKPELNNISEADTCDTNTALMIHQQIIQDYLNLYTPYRGLLLFYRHATCSAIALAEGLKDSKNVIIFTPSTFDIEQLKTCGECLFNKNQHWQWISVNNHPEQLQTLSKVLGLSEEFISKQGGAFLVHTKLESNYDELDENQQKKLEEQLNKMIMRKYQFIDYNHITESIVDNKTNHYSINMFDNSVVIIEEAHRFIGDIVDKLDNTDLSADNPFLKLYEMLMGAKNARIVLLTDTPVINSPHELGVLFNILRGYIVTWTLSLDTSKQKEKVTLPWLRKCISTSKSVDYVTYSENKLTITQNPFGFTSSSKHKGVKREIEKENEDNEIEDDFINEIKSLLKKENIRVTSTKVHYYKALPDQAAEFDAMFIDSKTKTMKNIETFQRRILGLTSYFSSVQDVLLPKFDKHIGKDFHILHIPMSKYQFDIYKPIREEERKKDEEPNTESSYRIASRLICNYAMLDADDTDNISEENEGETDSLQKTMHRMESHSDKYFSKKALVKYSPKFLQILKKIQDKKNQGLHLVYSHFRKAESMDLFGLVLKSNGFAHFKITKNTNGVWEIDIPHEERGKPMYALTDNKDEKQLLTKIYNGEWNDPGFPKNIREELERIHSNNNMGEIIKVFLSMDESSRFKNTRYVHLMDPYWQPVRAQKVVDNVYFTCSHLDLEPHLRSVQVFLYLTTFAGDNTIEQDKSKWTDKPITTDEYLYEISEEKATMNQQFMDAIKGAAFDCFLYSDSPSKCIQFGSPSIDTFAYSPDYKTDQKQKEDKINIVKDKNDVEYFAQHIGNNRYRLYDKASGEKYLEKRDKKELQPIGKMVVFVDEDGKNAYRIILD